MPTTCYASDKIGRRWNSPQCQALGQHTVLPTPNTYFFTHKNVNQIKQKGKLMCYTNWYEQY